jgi:hypothetical protein
MTAKIRRTYAGAAVQTFITVGIDSDDLTIGIDDTTGWASGSFYVVIDPGTASEEKVLIASRSGTTLTVSSRGVDGTTAKPHAGNATIYPVATAADFDEANELTSTYQNTGGMVYYDGTTFAQLAKGTTNYPLVAGASIPTYAQLTATGIANNAVTTDKINAAAVTVAKLAAEVAGSGLVGGAGDALAVNVDDSTLEIQSDTVQIKDAGVTAAKIGVLTNTTAKTDSFTLALVDRNTTILCDKSTAMTVTIPANADVALPVGSQISFVQIGAGQVTFAGDTGVTLNSDNSKKKILVQYGVASLIKTASDTWVLFGQLTA